MSTVFLMIALVVAIGFLFMALVYVWFIVHMVVDCLRYIFGQSGLR